ncbi:hypothetical protein LCGC14_0432560 [marine sediment metagenome]|uniref:Uncharacterized protein n=1 Tax=marine sediment metagenome TaxID=412755 RepID=A0A0F9T5L3_9ZZZZ
MNKTNKTTVDVLLRLIIQVREKHNRYSTIEINEDGFKSYICDDPFLEYGHQNHKTLEEVIERFHKFIDCDDLLKHSEEKIEKKITEIEENMENEATDLIRLKENLVNLKRKEI